MNYTRLLGSGLKWNTSETEYPKVDNELFNSFTTALNTLCKTFHILLADSYAPFHSFYDCLIRSRIFNLASPA